MRFMQVMRRARMLAPLAFAALQACGGDGVDPALPRLAAAAPAAMSGTCGALAAKLRYPRTAFTSVATAAAGALSVAGKPVGEHCVIAGKMNERVSAIDGETYAIGFEMRLPKAWNGRFFYQANGGLDGDVIAATGDIGGGGPLDNALRMGFAVISSDAGHSAAQNPLFGIDPDARLDYGYRAVDALTPMAKQVIRLAYGKAPDRSYFGGCSNGGRHAMVAAVRNAGDYDGIVAGDPGLHLPKAAIAEMAGAQQFARIATATAAAGRPDIRSGFTDTERRFVASRILAKCDALDGVADGLVEDIAACQARFDLNADVPGCTNGVRTSQCLTGAQKTALANVFAGARNSAGEALYASFPFDAGVSGDNWAAWKQGNAMTLDPAAAAFTFTTPPRRLRARLRHGPRRAGDLRDERRLCGIRVVVHDAAGRSGPVRAQAPRRQADRLSRHERSGVLVDRYDRLVRARDAGERRRCERLRALFSRRGDEPLLGRARRRPVRHADAACRVGRGRQGTGRDRRDRARRVERGTQSRGAGVMGRGAHAAAVPVSARRAIRRRRRERGGELQLPVTPSARAPRGA